MLDIIFALYVYKIVCISKDLIVVIMYLCATDEVFMSICYRWKTTVRTHGQ